MGHRRQARKDTEGGDTFYEPTGCLHRVSKNPGKKGTTRILAVVLRQKDGYELAEMNSRLIPHSDNSSHEDPMADGELTAQPGGFNLKLTLMSGAGSYEMETLHYRFRYQDGCFRLVGYDRMETNRATLDTHDLIVDFLTGVVIRRTGNAQSDATEEKSDTLKTNPRLCFRDLDNAEVFHPQ